MMLNPSGSLNICAISSTNDVEPSGFNIYSTFSFNEDHDNSERVEHIFLKIHYVIISYDTILERSFFSHPGIYLLSGNSNKSPLQDDRPPSEPDDGQPVCSRNQG